MDKVLIKPYNVIDHIELPELSVDQLPTDGDPLEIKGELYYVCEFLPKNPIESQRIGVIPLVVRNPAKVSNIENYIKCLSMAHRKVQFRNENGKCDLGSCNEMVIT